MNLQQNTIHVSTEVSSLKALIVHSPDSGLGKVVPSKAQDWLFEDIVHLDTMRKDEYDFYTLTLLYFLDKDKVKGKIHSILADKSRDFFKPDNAAYFNSDKVIEFQKLLSDILSNDSLKTQLIAAVVAVEGCSHRVHQLLMAMPAIALANTLITGSYNEKEMLFPPIPNLIFTRDIGIVVNDHLLLNKPARLARTREALLAKYIFFNHSLFEQLTGKIIEIEDDEYHFLLPEEQQDQHLTTIEGGDVMMVAPNHLLIGISERTTIDAARQAMNHLFERKVVEKVTIVKIPQKRDYMHIDTVFTQVKRNVWVLLATLARHNDAIKEAQVWEDLGQKPNHEVVNIKQFINTNEGVKIRDFENLEDLLASITKEDLHCWDEPKFVYSGNNEFPFGAREQWTDSCNLLVIKEGVAIGYDRNDKTLEAFRNAGFSTIKVADLLAKFETGELSSDTIQDTIIMLPSAELSRARGGSHCMSLPICRAEIS
jgi:arginine deiminase